MKTARRTVTLKERAYTAIKERILSSSLPPYEPISESELALELGISRTPVREALAALGQEGLVRIIPGKGAFVAGFSVSELEEIFAVREVIEGLAARSAAATIDPAELTRLESVFAAAEQNGSAMANLHGAAEKLHHLILASCGNSRVQRLIEQMNDQVRRIRMQATMVSGRRQHSVAEHLEIIRALKARDGAAAEAAMRNHIRSVLQVMRQSAAEGFRQVGVLM